MKKWPYLLLVLAAIFFESVFTTIPIVFLTVVVLYVIQKQAWILALAFSAGLFLDIMLVRQIGTTAFFLTCFLFLVFLYERKYEVQSYWFVFFSTIGGSLLYTLFFRGEVLIGESIAAALLSLLLFEVFFRLLPKKADLH